MNGFDRIQLNVRAGGSDGWTPDTPINLTRADAMDWKHVPATGGISSGPRKTSGPNSLAFSVVGSDAGFYATDVPPNPFVWSDGTSLTGANQSHLTTDQVVGNGYRIQVPMPRWPDWQILRVWNFSSALHQVAYSAYSDDIDSVAQSDSIGGPDGVRNVENDDLINAMQFVIEVRFASDLPGRTLTLDMLRYATSMGYYGFKGALLLRAPRLPFPARGATNRLIGRAA